MVQPGCLWGHAGKYADASQYLPWNACCMHGGSCIPTSVYCKASFPLMLVYSKKPRKHLAVPSHNPFVMLMIVADAALCALP